MNKFLAQILIIFAFCSCRAPKYNVLSTHKLRNGIKINIVEDIDKIAEIYGEKGAAYAFYDPKTKTIWVPENGIKDENGEIMPNLFLLGHEVWHVIKQDYHSKTNSTYSLPIMPEYDIILIKK